MKCREFSSVFLVWLNVSFCGSVQSIHLLWILNIFLGIVLLRFQQFTTVENCPQVENKDNYRGHSVSFFSWCFYCSHASCSMLENIFREPKVCEWGTLLAIFGPAVQADSLVFRPGEKVLLFSVSYIVLRIIVIYN